MKILTYNIWNTDRDFQARLELLAAALRAAGADIVALQEVRDEAVVDYLQKRCGFRHSLWKQFHDYQEGLALLSEHPITAARANWEEVAQVSNSYVLRTLVDCDGREIGVTNLHLDYKSALNRETAIVSAVKMVEEYPHSHYEFMAGDFNSYPTSSVHRYLTGQQSLANHATHWLDLAESYAVQSGGSAPATLDFFNNPRWDNEENHLWAPARFDWVMLQYPYPEDSLRLNSVDIVGTKREGNITPSDHYGVLCNLDL